VNLHTAEPALEEPVLEHGFEFIDGQAVEKSMSLQSSKVTVRLSKNLAAFVDDHNLGHVLDAEAGYQVFSGQPLKVRKPDASFIALGRFPDEELPRGNSHIPPDLMIETISPNNFAEDIEQRIADFLKAGTSLIWIVYPSTRSVWVLRQDGIAARLTEGQSISGENVVPGFSLPLASLFAGI
jgi:Uma2 family endonuclease